MKQLLNIDIRIENNNGVENILVYANAQNVFCMYVYFRYKNENHKINSYQKYIMRKVKQSDEMHTY